MFQRSQEKDFGAAEGVVESGAADEGGAGGWVQPPLDIRHRVITPKLWLQPNTVVFLVLQ